MPYYSPVHEKVLRYIREQDLLRAGDRLAAAVSGGADSVALLRVLLELSLGIGHRAMQSRTSIMACAASQSDADEAFVAELATAHGLDFFAGHGNVS